MRTSLTTPGGRTRALRALQSFAAISFAPVFLAASVAFLAGHLPARLETAFGSLDLGVLLLLVPLGALLFALIAEVVRAVVDSHPRTRALISSAAVPRHPSRR